MPIDPKQFTTRAALESPTAHYVADQQWFLDPPPRVPLTRWQRIQGRLKRASWAARWWIAEKVLWLPVGDDD